MVLVSHDLGVIGRVADRVLTMYAGRIVEESTTAEVFTTPHHPYTRGLLSCIPGRAPEGPRWCRSRGSHRASFGCPRDARSATLPARRGPVPRVVAAVADDLGDPSVRVHPARRDRRTADATPGDRPLRARRGPNRRHRRIGRTAAAPHDRAGQALPGPPPGLFERGAECAPSTASTSTSAAARRSGSSVSPARASRRWRGCRRPDHADRRAGRDRRGRPGRARPRQLRALRRDVQVISRIPTARSTRDVASGRSSPIRS